MGSVVSKATTCIKYDPINHTNQSHQKKLWIQAHPPCLHSFSPLDPRALFSGPHKTILPTPLQGTATTTTTTTTTMNQQDPPCVRARGHKFLSRTHQNRKITGFDPTKAYTEARATHTNRHRVAVNPRQRARERLRARDADELPPL